VKTLVLRYGGFLFTRSVVVDPISNVVWQFVLHIPRDVTRTVKVVWQLPNNMVTGPELEFNWSILPIKIMTDAASEPNLRITLNKTLTKKR
jgi:hypothetical protein